MEEPAEGKPRREAGACSPPRPTPPASPAHLRASSPLPAASRLAYTCLLITTTSVFSPSVRRYQAHFATYLKAGVEPDELEDLYTKVLRAGERYQQYHQQCQLQ